MRVFLQTYLNNNLGDDLFVHIITNRYKNCNFETVTLYNSTSKFGDNFSLKFRNTAKLVNKIIKILSFNHTNLENEYMKRCDFTCLIGGSMFIEQDDSLKQKYFIGGGKKYYIIGTNFGPYKTKEYYNRFYKIFEKAEDVCFRDKNSYDLFSNLNPVRIAPDIVFSLQYDLPEIYKEKRVVISCIDCLKKVGLKYKENYEKKIIEFIKYFYAREYKITLMSFCKGEGDEEAIKSIVKKLDNQNLKDNIEIYNYNGNIDTALKTLANSNIIIGSRFHANILGLVMNKTIIPIAYSDKTINALKDINFKGKIMDIRKMDEFDVSKLNNEDLNYKLDIEQYKRESQKHFEKLDYVLKNL